MKCNRITLVFIFAFISVIFSANGISAVTEEDVVSTSDEEPNNPVVIEVIEFMLRKCMKKGDPIAMEQALAGRETFRQCVKSIVDRSVVEKELEIARSLQDVRVVVSKYCRKVPQVVECVKNFTVGVVSCLEPNQTKTANDDFLATILNTVCYNDGERLSQFISERGHVCMVEMIDFAQKCRIQMISNITAIKDNADAELTNEQKDALCQTTVRGLQTCIVQKLSTCEQQSPAILVDSLFNATVNMIGCGEYSNRPVTLNLEL